MITKDEFMCNSNSRSLIYDPWVDKEGWRLPAIYSALNQLSWWRYHHEDGPHPPTRIA